VRGSVTKYSKIQTNTLGVDYMKKQLTDLTAAEQLAWQRQVIREEMKEEGEKNER
jgi:hypothetical protein